MAKLANKLIYVAHPYSDNPEANIKAVTESIKRLQHMFPEMTFVSPLHTFNFHEGVFSYETTMAHCLTLLGKCDHAVFPDYYERSEGCKVEYAYCQCYDIPISTYEIVEEKSEENGDGREV